MNRRNYTHKRVKKRRTLRGGSRIKQNTLNKNLVREAIGGGPIRYTKRKIVTGFNNLTTRLQAMDVQNKKIDYDFYAEAFTQIPGVIDQILNLPQNNYQRE